MLASSDKTTPYSAYPRDVTSPGPDQRPGVVKSKQSKGTSSESGEFERPQAPDKGEKPHTLPEK
jgi:hypothetical protein